MRGKRIITAFIAVALIFSALVVIKEVTDFEIAENALATGEVAKNGATKGLNLTCGELITFKVVDNSLTYDEEYTLAVWNGTSWIKMESATADYNGDISIDFNVPWMGLLGMNPLRNNGGGALANGQWNIRLFNTSTVSDMVAANYASDNVTLTISNIYEVKFYEVSTSGSSNVWTEIDYIMFNRSYEVDNDNQFGVKVRNYTGATYGAGDWDDDWDDSGDETFDYSLYLPDYTQYTASTWSATAEDGDYFNQFLNGLTGTGYRDGNNYENYFWVNVSVNGNGDLWSFVPLPCLLNVSWQNAPGSLVWGTHTDVSISVKVKDGDINSNDGNDIETSGYANYEMALYAPIDGGWIQVDTGETGASYWNVNEFSTTDYSAGTWYIGTYEDDDTDYRVKFTSPDWPDNLPAAFIPYLEFEVATYDNIDVDFRGTTQIISGFEQTINISVENKSGYNSDVYDSLTSDNFHIYGLKGYNQSANEAFDDEDIIAITELPAGGGRVSMTKDTDARAYYEFTYQFNQTGTATVIVSYPGNGTYKQNSDSFYSDTYNNENLLANWTGTTTFDVASPGNLNMIIRGTMPDSVNVVADGQAYINSSQSFVIDFYGSDNSERINATLHVEGCGLDFTILQNDTVAGNDYLLDKGNGYYEVKLEPRFGGILTLTATNGSDTDTADYTIDGLTGSVTTSIDDNKQISVTHGEKITVEVKSPGGYPIETADVYLSLYDEDWTKVGSGKINSSAGDDLDGDDGIYEFYPSDDDIENVGFIVCAATSGSLWMYEIVELVPVHDINVTITNPSATVNQTLTVGIDDQTLEVQIRGPDGNILEDGDPTVVGYLIDNDHSEDDPLQTLVFEEKSGDIWALDDTSNNFPFWPGTLVIKAVNNSGESEHDGNVTIPVEYGSVSFSPTAAVAGIGKRNVTVTITVKDALGNPVEEGIDVFVNKKDATDTVITDEADAIELDENGEAEFEIDTVGDLTGTINVSFQHNYSNAVPANDEGNLTTGEFIIGFPVFSVEPGTVSSLIESASVLVTAKDYNDEPLEGINLTFRSLAGRVVENPDPVMTDASGEAFFDGIEILSAGKANVTIVKGLTWRTNGTFTYNELVYTTSVLTVARQTLEVTVSPAMVYYGDTFTVTVKDDDGNLIDDANVNIVGVGDYKTENGVTDPITAPNPGIDSYEYEITVTKLGYPDETAKILVINLYQIKITGPDEANKDGTFTITVVARGAALAGATVTFEEQTETTDNDGKATFDSPAKKGTYTVTATFPENSQYKSGTFEITVVEGESPGFELLTLVIALGVAFILLRRRRK